MRDHFSERRVQEDVQPPATCPVCKSRDLTTTSKTVSASSYWRCVTCGEVWNVERLEAGSRYWPRYR